ncbi:unannotated protein [freshwater metagenome]|uniref:Unannotated protein n=1 Tax=freshwater metagenome TaxID=449393 RepID=A0A6J7C5V4_9ZZZZ
MGRPTGDPARVRSGPGCSHWRSLTSGRWRVARGCTRACPGGRGGPLGGVHQCLARGRGGIGRGCPRVAHPPGTPRGPPARIGILGGGRPPPSPRPDGRAHLLPRAARCRRSPMGSYLGRRHLCDIARRHRRDLRRTYRHGGRDSATAMAGTIVRTAGRHRSGTDLATGFWHVPVARRRGVLHPGPLVGCCIARAHRQRDLCS